MSRLRLVKLTLVGFKSFADRTELRFDRPITAVVGPNGCGKSNIVDAVRWVLGERSAKSLRSSEMQDVLFAGSAARGPSGLASVTLTFENPLLSASQRDQQARRCDNGEVAEALPDDLDERSPLVRDPARRTRALPIDAETVDVERRLHRDGQSLYLINGRRVRLRDVRELFLDTGVGADAYSIIEQGKVDAMLLASPLDRRTIFEEAAGVARFKARRLEARRKLERCETNLAVVREKLASTERRLRIVRSQAEKARRHQSLTNELNAWRTALALDKRRLLCEQLVGLTSRMAQLERERDDAFQTLRAMEQQRQEALLTLQQAQERDRQLHAQSLRCQHEIEQAQQRSAMRQRAAQQARQRAAEEQQAAKRLREQVASLTAERLEAAQTLAQAKTRHEAAQRDAEECLRRKTRLEEQLASAKEALRAKQHQIDDLSRRVSEEDRSLHALEERVAQLQEQQASAQRRLAESREAQEQARGALQGALQTLQQREGDVAHSQRELAAAEEALQTLSRTQRTRADELAQLENERAAVASRRQTLHELQRSREGVAAGAKAALQLCAEANAQGQHTPLAAVRGLLADVVETDAACAVAVETALGEALSALLVDEDRLEEAAKALEPALEHPCLLLPLPSRSDDAPAESLPCAADHALERTAPPLASLARTSDPRAHSLVRQLLADARLAPTLEAATLLAAAAKAQSSKPLRFVTPAGDVVDTQGGVRLAGSRNQQGEHLGLLSRKAALAELDSQLRDLALRITQTQAKLRDLDEQAAQAHRRRAAASHRLFQAERRLAQAQAARDRAAADVDRLHKDVARAQQSLQTLERRLQADLQARDDRHEVLASLRRLAEEQRRELQDLSRATAHQERQRDEAVEQAARARAEAHTTAEAVTAAQRRLQELDDAVASVEASLEERADRGRREEEQARREQAQAQEETQRAEQLEAQHRQLLRSMEEGRAALQRAQEAVERSGEALETARNRQRHLERDWNSLELSRREVEIKRETLEEQTLEEMGLDLESLAEEYEQLLASGVAPVDHDQAQRAIDELKKALKKLGNVNLEAIAEAEALESRNLDLEAQVADLDEARQRLETLIARLSVVSEERFRATFEAIQQRFGGEKGMFRTLFGGGSAELRLLPTAETGEIDWLESGVEIIAKPPGKRPRTINQLSGGEKTMTSVALLLSIFESRPSPFCILDEVDAALDDANVERYVRTLRRLTETSQLIVITHNKRTMQAADVLYGVTMPERGVSRKVEVQLDEIDEDGGFAASGADEAASTPGERATQATPSARPQPVVVVEPATTPAHSGAA